MVWKLIFQSIKNATKRENQLEGWDEYIISEWLIYYKLFKEQTSGLVSNQLFYINFLSVSPHDKESSGCLFVETKWNCQTRKQNTYHILTSKWELRNEIFVVGRKNVRIVSDKTRNRKPSLCVPPICKPRSIVSNT